MSHRHLDRRDRIDDLRREKGAAAQFRRVRARELRRQRPGEPLVDRDAEPVAAPRVGSLREWLIANDFLRPDPDADLPRKGRS